jgi:hypothetical protein
MVVNMSPIPVVTEFLNSSHDAAGASKCSEVVLKNVDTSFGKTSYN